MKIYIASSWRNQHAVEALTDSLEARGHKVFSFVRMTYGNEPHVSLQYNDPTEWIESYDGQCKFKYDTNAARGSDITIYIGPSGCDAWAEVGAAWANGVRVLGLWSKGEEIGLMRRMVSAWFRDYRELLAMIDDLS